jgi:cytoskeletal protein CcmA (bactofilin family)
MPPFPSGEISLAPSAPARHLPAEPTAQEPATSAASDITRQFIRAKRPCADGYRWYLRRQEGASNYQALLDDLVREGRIEDACWMLDQFGPTNDVLEVDHLEADALVFAGSVRCQGSADVDGVLRTGRSLSVLGGLRVGGALRVGEDLRVSGALRCDGSVRLHGDARVGWSLAVAQRLQCAGTLRVGGELDGGASVQIAGHCTVGQDLRAVGALDCGGGAKVGGHLHCGAEVQAQRGLQVAGDVDCHGHLQVGWGVRAGGHIHAGGAIRAGESLWAGETIAAGEAYGVYAGLVVPLPDWPHSARVCAKEPPARLLSGCWAGGQESAP